MARRYLVLRTVRKDEPHNWADRDVFYGEIFYEFEGPTYGSCDTLNGVVLAGPADTFFEFPRDAVGEVQ